MSRTPRFLSALLLMSALRASADVVSDDKKKTPKEQIEAACSSDAATVRVEDKEGVDPQKDADAVLGAVGAPGWREGGEGGQTITVERKKGKKAKKKCVDDLTRLERRMPGRVSFEPTTEERLAEVKKRGDAIMPKVLRLNPADTQAAARVFDGGVLLGRDFSTGGGETTAGGGWRTGFTQASYELPSVQRPSNFGTRAANPPTPAFYSAPSITTTLSDGWNRGSAWVSAKLSDAGGTISGYGRSVRNAFFSGMEMLTGTGYKMVKAFRDSNWGVTPLVRGLQRIFAYLRGSGAAQTDVAIGDISSRSGGRLGGHLSHARGRDVDIGFYIIDAAGKPVEAQEFVKFNQGRDGLSGYYAGKLVRFDAQRNWLMIQAILSNPEPGFEPTNIFIADHLKKAVLAAAGEDPLRGRAAGLMSYWPGHENHLHLRVK